MRWWDASHARGGKGVVRFPACRRVDDYAACFRAMSRLYAIDIADRMDPPGGYLTVAARWPCRRVRWSHAATGGRRRGCATGATTWPPGPAPRRKGIPGP